MCIRDRSGTGEVGLHPQLLPPPNSRLPPATPPPISTLLKRTYTIVLRIRLKTAFLHIHKRRSVQYTSINDNDYQYQQ
ncbi:hypothetical protein, partial [Paenibacillus whitsoniae]|uniref:hypothetical protein n=1 Tax=Paenibacillus whitsoniae TaxID=2496558 RepID=UPI0019D0D579